jgi:hypothetical protein
MALAEIYAQAAFTGRPPAWTVNLACNNQKRRTTHRFNFYAPAELMSARTTELTAVTSLSFYGGGKKRVKTMAAPQMLYLKRGFLKDIPYNTHNWGIEQTDGFETEGEAQAVRVECKDASGVIEKDGRFYVMKVGTTD